jgi:putative FmdB family regulatory protein
MPVYEYGCEAGHRFEVKQKFSDSPLTTCRVCSLPVTKLISASGISFKGSGWYVTDYSNKLKDPATQEKPAATEAAAKESAPAGEAKSAPPASPPSSDSSSTKTDSSPSSNGGSSPGPSSPVPPGS